MTATERDLLDRSVRLILGLRFLLPARLHPDLDTPSQRAHRAIDELTRDYSALGAGAPAREPNGDRAAAAEGHPWEPQDVAELRAFARWWHEDRKSFIQSASGFATNPSRTAAVSDALLLSLLAALVDRSFPATPKATAGDPAGAVPSKPAPAIALCECWHPCSAGRAWCSDGKAFEHLSLPYARHQRFCAAPSPVNDRLCSLAVGHAGPHAIHDYDPNTGEAPVKAVWPQ